MIEHLTAQSFEDAVTGSEVPLLLDFWSPSCGPCKLQEKVLNELETDSDRQFQIKKINVWDEPELATRFQISAVPTLVIFNQGKIVRSLVGYHDKSKLLLALQQIDKNTAGNRVSMPASA